MIQYHSFPSIESEEPLVSKISIRLKNIGKFNLLGQEAIIQAKANENLVEFAGTLPPPNNVQKC